MAFQLSPGITVSEIDLTTIVPAVGTTVGALAGPFRWGPANQLTLIDSELTLRSTFGTPDNTCASTWFTASNFLSYANALQLVRTVHAGNGGHKNATADGSGVLIPNSDYYDVNYAGGQGAAGMFAAKYPGDLGNTLLVSLADSKSFPSWAYAGRFQSTPGTSDFVANGGGSGDELHVIVIDAGGKFTGVPGTILEQFPFVSKCATAKSASGTSIYYAEVINRTSKYIWWMDHPSQGDLGTNSTVNWGGIESTTFLSTVTTIALTSVTGGTFSTGNTVTSLTTGTITVADGGATGTVITDGSGHITGVTITNGGTGIYTGAPTVTFAGAGSGATGTATVVNGVVTAVNVTAQGTGYTGSPTVAFSVPGSGATITNVTVNNAGAITAITLGSGGSGYTAPPLVAISGTGTGAVVTANITGNAVSGFTIVNGGTAYNPIVAKVVSFTSGGGSTGTLMVTPTSGTPVSGLKISNGSGVTAITGAVTGGPITKSLAGGVDGNANVTDGDRMIGYDAFASSENVDISLILTGDASPTVGTYLIQQIAENRKDCVVFVSPLQSDVVSNPGSEAVDIILTRNLYPDSSYAVMDSGWKYAYDKYNDTYRWLPLNGDIAGLCAYTDDVRDAWWSPAGYNRGSIKNVVKLAFNPRKAERDLLFNGGVNPVISQPGQGTTLFGDKTMQRKPSAFDRINVRRLFIVLEKAIATAAKYTLFEFNDAFTRAQFSNMITPFLSTVKGRRGITDFLVVCDTTNNPPSVVDANQFVGDIYVKPARSINFIQLNFVAVASGVQFSEVVGKF
jgi:hypothetical protein